MTWLKRLTDRLVLWPSTEYVDPGVLIREMIPAGDDQLEAWTISTNVNVVGPKLLVVKFIGNAGRAECSSARPASLWADVNGEIWTINPFGYGRSTGEASLQRFPEMVDSVYAHVRSKFPDHKLLVFGNSIGSISALMLAAKYPVDGVYIRNPVPIHQLIGTRPRYAWPSLGLSRVVAMQIPRALNAVENAKKVTAPGLFVTSMEDTLVPPKFQYKVMDVYGGPKKILPVPIGHNAPIPDEMEEQYLAAANWLLEMVVGDKTV